MEPGKASEGKRKEINTASKQSLCFSEYDICPFFTSGKNNKDTYTSNGNRMNNRETFQVSLVKENNFIVIVPIW